MQKSSSALLEDLLDFAFTFGFADYIIMVKFASQRKYFA